MAGFRTGTGGGAGFRVGTGGGGFRTGSYSPSRDDDDDGGIFRWSHDFLGTGLDVPLIKPNWKTINPWYTAASAAEQAGAPLAARIPLRVGGALSTALPYSVRYPRSTANEIGSMITGAFELPSAVYAMRSGGKGFDWSRGIFYPFVHKYEGGMSWKEIGSIFADSVIEDYKTRYGKDWKEQAEKRPLSNMFDLLSVLGIGMRGTALAEASSRLKAAGLSRNARMLWEESSRPGIHVADEPFTRDLRFQPETGEAISSTQPLSRSPVRRGFQQVTDNLAQGKIGTTGIPGIDSVVNKLAGELPKTPLFGARARITRADANQLKRSLDRVLGLAVHTPAVNALSKAERTRLYWGSQLGDHSPEMLTRLREVLDDEYNIPLEDIMPDQEFADWLRQAKQQGFGPVILKNLDDAIAAAKKAPTEAEWSPRYRNAELAMREMTNLSEEVIRDADGFTNLRNDLTRLNDRLDLIGEDHPEADGIRAQIARLEEQLVNKKAQLDRTFGSRRGRVRGWLDNKPVRRSKERAAWEKWMRDRNWDPAQISYALKIGDLRARVARPHDPQGYWADRIGMPTEEKAAEFVSRAAEALMQPRRPRTAEGDQLLADLVDDGPEGVKALYDSEDPQSAVADELGDSPPEHVLESARQAAYEMSQDFLRRKFGDEVTVYRGGGRARETRDFIPWTTDRDVARFFAGNNDADIQELTIPIEDVEVALEGLPRGEWHGMTEGEVLLPGQRTGGQGRLFQRAGRSLVPDDPRAWERWGDDVEMVTIDDLRPMRDQVDTLDEGKITKLMDDIRENGLEEPLILDWALDSSRAYLSEGNNRLEALERLGYREAPARVITVSRFNERHGGVPTEPRPYTDEFGEVYEAPEDLPQYTSPSQVGIEGVPWREAETDQPRRPLFQVPGEVAELYPEGSREPLMPDKLKTKGVTKKVYDLIRQGAPYRDWYERGAAVIKDFAERQDITPAQAAAIVAITSQQANPTFNLRRAAELLAEYKAWKRGEIPEIDASRYFAGQADKVTHVLDNPDTFNWAGLKTNSYFANFLEELDPRFYEQLFGKDAHKVTVDRHIANMILGKKSVTDAQYEKVAQLFTDVADELGWKPKEVQAAAWVPWKAQEMGISEEVKALSREMTKRGEIPEELMGKTGPVQKRRAQFVRDEYMSGRRAEGYSKKPVTHYLDTAADAYERGREQFRGVLYQDRPAIDPAALPKGATEFLADGRTAIRMFEGGDISTWIHELGHIAVHDLDGPDLQVLEDAFAGGKAYSHWTTEENEAFARAFERYFVDGVAPSAELKGVFEKLANWMKRIWEDEKLNVPEISDDVRDVFHSLLVKHEPGVFIPHRAGAPNMTGARTSRGIPRAARAMGDWTASRIPMFKRNNMNLVEGALVNDDPRLLIEHMNRVVMLARANQLRETVLQMGEPLKPGQYPDFDTQYVVKKFGRGVDDVTYDALERVDNPNEVARTISNFIDDNITDDRDRYESWLEETSKDRSSDDGYDPRWAAWKGEDQLYVVDKKITDELFKNVTGKTPGATTKPQGNWSKALDAALDTTRAMLLYANPGFYVANIVGNSFMAGMLNPSSYKYVVWSMNNARKAATHEDTAAPRWHRIASEMGRGPTAGGLSQTIPGREAIVGSDQGFRGIPAELRERGVGGALESLTSGYANWGRRSGHVIDDAFRVAAWRAVAAKHGVKSDADIDKLFADATETTRGLARSAKEEGSRGKAQRQLNSIRDEAEQLMLDFDSMTPFEKTWLTRVIFLYPFVKASTKYPFMYAGERPIVTGVAGGTAVRGQEFAEREEALGPRPDLPAWLRLAARGPGGELWNVGSLAPMNVNLLETGLALGQKPELGIGTPFEMLNPFTQMAIELAQGRTGFGTEANAAEILRQEAPVPAWIAQNPWFGWKEPSQIYADRDYWHALLRAARGPFRVNTQAASGG